MQHYARQEKMNQVSIFMVFLLFFELRYSSFRIA